MGFVPPSPPELIDLGEIGFSSENQGVTLIRFTSQGDSKVCPECDSLDGNVYAINDPDLPELPKHENCRCFYEDAQLGGEVEP